MTIRIKVTTSGTIDGSDVEADIGLSRTLADGEDIDAAAAALRQRADAMLHPPALPQGVESADEQPGGEHEA